MTGERHEDYLDMWFVRGIRGGIHTPALPESADPASGMSPGLPQGVERAEAEQQSLSAVCPTNAIVNVADRVDVREERCVHCMRCTPGIAEKPLPLRYDTAWATAVNHLLEDASLPTAFRHSAHVRVIDSGDCGACLSEIVHLNDPLYNLHRLGIFITPTPRQADILLVVGPVTEHMRGPLIEAYEAMPEPKRVMAVGACAASGGVFGPSFASAGGLVDVLPVDVVVPGCPPPPIVILQALIALAGKSRKP